jgi:hypothetical protein
MRTSPGDDCIEKAAQAERGWQGPSAERPALTTLRAKDDL